MLDCKEAEISPKADLTVSVAVSGSFDFFEERRLLLVGALCSLPMIQIQVPMLTFAK
jgi:hypothetical protein